MDFHLSQYRIFYAVARTGSLSRAARELLISQPAVSKAIHKLEAEMKTPLFQRKSRGVSLTPEGEILYDYVSRAFQTLSEGENEIRRIQNLSIGQLRIGVSLPLCRQFLLPKVRDFIRLYPYVRIQIHTQPSTRTLPMLENDELDIGLTLEPKGRKSLVFLPAFTIHDCLVCSPVYLENLRIQEGEDADVFRNGTLFMLESSNMTHVHIAEYFRANGIEPRQTMEISSMDLIIDFLRAGIGFGFVLRELVSEHLQSGELVEIPLKTPITSREIGFTTPRTGVSKITKDFLSFCTGEESF